jgi:hypothetical protein
MIWTAVVSTYIATFADALADLFNDSELFVVRYKHDSVLTYTITYND